MVKGGVCMVKEACMVKEGMHSEGGMHGKGDIVVGCVWQGGHAWQRVHAGETATEASGMHPTGCILLEQGFIYRKFRHHFHRSYTGRDGNRLGPNLYLIFSSFRY